MDIILQGLSFSFINVYAPNVGYERGLFFKKLQDAMINIPRDNLIIVAGDFNCTLDHIVDRNHILFALCVILSV